MPIYLNLNSICLFNSLRMRLKMFDDIDGDFEEEEEFKQKKKRKDDKKYGLSDDY